MTIVNVNYSSLDEVFGSDFNKKKKKKPKKERKPKDAACNYYARRYDKNNDKDLDIALDWINKALEKSDKNFRYGLLKAKIYKANDNVGMSISTVKTAHEWAVEAKNDNYISQTDVYLKSIEK